MRGIPSSTLWPGSGSQASLLAAHCQQLPVCQHCSETQPTASKVDTENMPGSKFPRSVNFRNMLTYTQCLTAQRHAHCER